MGKPAPAPVIIQKNKSEEIRAAVTHFKGHDLLDVRTYMEFKDSDGDRKPTKKGFSLNIEKFPELIEALQSLQASLSNDGGRA